MAHSENYFFSNHVFSFDKGVTLINRFAKYLEQTSTQIRGDEFRQRRNRV